MARIRRIVLDVLKPHEPTSVEMASRLADLPGVDSVNLTIYEVDLKVENAKITIEGSHVDVEQAHTLIRELGGALHSVDEVVAGKAIIESTPTPQD